MLDILTIICMCGGVIFFIGASLGVLRLPDFYTRGHAAAKGDTLSTLLFLIGFAVYNLHHLDAGHILVSLKMMMIVVFVSIASPTGAHAIINAGYAAGAKPWTKEDLKKEGDEANDDTVL